VLFKTASFPDSDLESSEKESESEDKRIGPSQTHNEQIEDISETFSPEPVATFNWKANHSFLPNVQPFEPYAEKIKDANLSRILEDNCTPFSVLKFFIDDNMVAEIIAQSEKFARDLEKKILL